MIFTNIAEKSRFIKNISNCYEKTFFFNHCVISGCDGTATRSRYYIKCQLQENNKTKMTNNN